MPSRKHALALATVTILSLVFCSFSYRDVEDELGYGFRPQPSFIGTMMEELMLQGLPLIESDVFGPEMVDDLVNGSPRVVSVDAFGAKGDGRSDDTKAFQNAWNAACSSSTGASIVITKNKKYLLKPIRFKGPCKYSITVQVYGTIVASDNRSDYNNDRTHWLVFDSVQNLTVGGNGVLDGNGKVWWPSSCKINKALPCKDAPTALTFSKTNNLVVGKLKVQNAQQIHVSFQNCVNVHVSSLTVMAPATSPNTDGIHISGTKNIRIAGSDIGTGDDCISIVSGSQNVHASDITCGPGHGISVGSLGGGNSEAYVSHILVDGATLTGTTNGVRIKTTQGGSGSARNITFQNIQMYNVANPIIIDQNYCDQVQPCKNQGKALQIQDVLYQNIRGTSASAVGITLDCSKSFPCKGIVLEEINIVGKGGASSRATCNNAGVRYVGSVSPRCPQKKLKREWQRCVPWQSW